MLFQTLEFLILFFAVWPWAVWGPSRIRRGALLTASYMFYMWFSVPLVSLLIFSSLLDFFVGRAIFRSRDARRRKALLLLSLVGNLGVLFVFKYFNFFTGSVNSLCHAVTGAAPFPHYEIILPIGISFYTFQTLSYTIDIYRGKMQPTDSLLTFALYVSFFPQLVAGPIVRAAQLVPQLARGPQFVPGQLRQAVGYIVLGLLKKVVVADNLAPYADQVFAAPAAAGGWDVLFGTYAFAFQIYCDFSGYTDMARGIAALLGYDIGRNFNYPYIAQSVGEFWHRWHISLSTWFRDYVYIPLGGNRVSLPRWYLNVMLVFLISGLWHGANWTFVLWGALHGAYMVIGAATRAWRTRVWEKSPFMQKSWLTAAVRVIVTFHLVAAGWVLFRAESLGDAMHLWAGLTRWGSAPTVGAGMWAYIGGLMALEAVALTTPAAKVILSNRYLFWLTVVTGWVIYLIFGNIGGADFVYFQF